MEVSSDRSIWTIPPQFALWIPARTFHSIQMLGKVRMRTLYFHAGVIPRRPPESSLLYITPLLRELIVETVRFGRLRQRNRLECALHDLLTAKIETATAAPIGLTMPSEPRALAVAQLILCNLSGARPFTSLCAEAGVGVRTAQRIYKRELGIDLETWRRQARLTKAVQLLVAGRSVKEISSCVGYRQSSTFVEAFRRLFGSPPKAWTAAMCSGQPFQTPAETEQP